MMRTLEERKATSLNGVSGHILKECSQQMIKTKTGKILEEWKRADIISICKSGSKEESLD